MASSSWEEQRQAARPYYKHRSPAETGLYRIVYHNRDELPRVWEDRFQPDYGVLRDEVLETLDAYLDCGIFAHGFATAVCENEQCKLTTLNKGVPAAAFAIQTAGDSLNFNPHLHSFVADGVFDKDNTFHKLGFMDCEKLTLLFAHKVLAAMLEKGLIPQAVVDSILTQKHTGFSVWAGDTINPKDQDARLFIARYIDRGPVANSKISIDGDTVTYLTKDGLTHEFDPLEFLARITPHVARKWEQTVRYYGYYSSKSRGLRKKTALDTNPPLTISTEPPPPKKTVSRKWAELIKKVYEIDPLVCPKCGEFLKIKKLWGPDDQADIRQILTKLGIPPFKTPPPITSPPTGVQVEILLDHLETSDNDF